MQLADLGKLVKEMDTHTTIEHYLLSKCNDL